MRAVYLAATIVMTAGCGRAVMIEKPYEWPKYSPQYYSQQGEVAYSLSGSNASIESGKYSAYRLMQNACRGPYRITGEFSSYLPESSTIQNAEAPTVATRHLRFECRSNTPVYPCHSRIGVCR